MKKIAVIFGGRSCEREISVLTGVFALNALDRLKYEPVPVYVHADGELYSSPDMTNLEVFKLGTVEKFKRVIFDSGTLYTTDKKKKRLKPIGKIDGALNCCHGGWGEGGGVSALMEMNGIPLASPPISASGVFLDKALTKIFVKGLQIPTLDFTCVQESDYQKRGRFLLKNIQSRLGYPVVIKPAKLGSSIGITVARTEAETAQGLSLAFRLDDKAIIEKYLEGKSDVNCAVYFRQGEIVVSEPEIACSEDGVYSFEDKYLSNRRGNEKDGGQVRELDEETSQRIKAYTKTLYKKSGLFGVARMDFLVRDKEVYLSEVNTVPGSLAYYLFCERLTESRAFFSDLLEEAFVRAKKREKELPETGILSTVKLGGKRKIRL
ncbi:MAG: ATP-grasp domain-containing protein [Clostridia bacterium]|nr:ATP-grasp domain-containing protein [Clostridia bacterium]